jgi:hypothetical protein
MTPPVRPSDAESFRQYTSSSRIPVASPGSDGSTGGGDGGPTQKTDGGSGVVAVLTVLMMVGSIVVPAVYNYLGFAEQKVTVVTTAVKADSARWLLTGRVLYDGEPMTARVSVIVSNSLGNRVAPASVSTDTAGYFAFPPIDERLARDSVHGAASEVTVMVRGKSPRDTTIVRAEESLRLSKEARTRWVRLPPSMLLTVVVIFVVSVIVGIWNTHTALGRNVQYYGTIALAFLLTGSVIVFISLGLRLVNLTGAEGDVITLGFANMFKGTYVKDIPQEWLFSLTAPAQPATGTPQLARGFGAPLWALLVSVFGSGLFTIRLIVRQVKSPVDVNNVRQFRDRLQEVVLHQFYIFFAPLGAVFIYQLLVAAGAASVETTVAIAMLAAGAALNGLLDRALNAVQNAVDERKRSAYYRKRASEARDEVARKAQQAVIVAP